MLVRAALQHKRLKKRAFEIALGLGEALRNASAVIFTSEIERDTSDLSRLGPPARTSREVVPLPVAIPGSERDLPSLRQAGRARWLATEANDPGRTLLGGESQVDLNTPLLVFMGRLHPVKRVDLTLKAFALARESSPDARLLLIGKGEDDYTRWLKAESERLGVAPALRWAGWLHGRDKLQALAAGDALVLNSEFENFGYAIVEGLVMGTPVVVTENLSLAPAIAEIGAGASAAAEPRALADAMLRILSRPDDARREMGLRGRHWVEAQFSRQAVGTRLATLYTQLAGSR
jgi:glycosyltransferase involved in cell wall biosynthesis